MSQDCPLDAGNDLENSLRRPDSPRNSRLSPVGYRLSAIAPITITATCHFNSLSIRNAFATSVCLLLRKRVTLFHDCFSVSNTLKKFDFGGCPMRTCLVLAVRIRMALNASQFSIKEQRHATGHESLGTRKNLPPFALTGELTCARLKFRTPVKNLRAAPDNYAD